MNLRTRRIDPSRCAICRTAAGIVLTGFLVLFVDEACAAANPLEIGGNGRSLVLTWEGDGVLQSADDPDGPWHDETGAVSPHGIVPSDSRSFYRVFYPLGFNSLFEPPEMAFGEPNAAPSAVAHELAHVWQQRKSGFLPEVGDEVVVAFYSGEVQCTAVDLRIKGRGLDFIWARKYRSRVGPDTAQGNRWDFSYNIHIQRSGRHVRVFDGNGRRDVYLVQSDGTFAADQLFRQGRFDSDGVFTLLFADRGVWQFLPFDGRPAEGKLSRIADRNGNELTFAYDGRGRLVAVTDTLDRKITVSYNVDGFIEAVTDFTGRKVRYAFYTDPEPGGSFGDLKSVTSPIVTNSPTGNDFPSGKTTTYSYTEGFADPRANHMLLARTDADAQTTHEHVYQTSQTDLDFLRVRAQRVGNAGQNLMFSYVFETPAASNGLAVLKTIVNDRVGNVKEYSYDAGNRLVMMREFTGRAISGQPTTETLNRPRNPLRTNDPPFFETRYEWNEDSLLTRIIYPNGNSISNTYELALNPLVGRRSRGNLRSVERLPGPTGGDQTGIVEYFDYDSDTSHCCDFNFLTRYTDARSNDTFYAYDERGNCTNIIHRIPSITEDFAYNDSGQLTAYTAPDNGSGQRARFEGKYYVTGANHSYLHQIIADADSAGLNLTTTYEYDAVGNVLRTTDPRGNDSLFTYNQLDQLVRSQSPVVAVVGGQPIRYTQEFYYDARDNLIRVDTENRDETGALVSSNTHFTVTSVYDVLNCRTQLVREVSTARFVTNEFSYDANRNLTLLRFPEAVKGSQTGNVVRLTYDERDLLFQRMRAPGQPDESMDQFDYDGNENSRRVARKDAFTIKQQILEHDGFNRLVKVTDAMGNVATWHYDPNGNIVGERFDGELNDLPGAETNIRLAESASTFDPMDREVIRIRAHYGLSTQAPIGDGQSVNTFTYADTSQLLSVTDDNQHTTHYNYDRVNRLLTITDPRTNSVTYDYDPNGNVLAVKESGKSDLGHPDQRFITQFQYDAMNRQVKQMDTMTNTILVAYDSLNNPVLMKDAAGNQTREIYDGLSRQIAVVQDMNMNGPSPNDPIDITVRREWDDSSRLIAQTDDSTNTTRYVYDALNRLIQKIEPDGTSDRLAYDGHDNMIMMRDANSNVVTFAYDLLNRVTNKSIMPGPGVSSDTTFERFAYDGFSRLMLAQDDDATNMLSWDSLGNVTRETINGASATSAHDGEGNQLTQVYPGGRRLDFAYDAINNATQCVEGGANVFTREIVGVKRTEQLNFANGTSTDYSYDGLLGVPNGPGDFGVGKVVRIRNQLVAPWDDRMFSWDRNQNSVLRMELVPAETTYLYSYDPADRLSRTRVLQPLSGIMRDTRYALDGAGNRISVAEGANPQFYRRNAMLPEPADFQENQYSLTPFDAREYDANGNLVAIDSGQRSEQQLFFDYRNQLVRHVAPDGTTVRYAYDPFGCRIAKIVTPKVGTSMTNRYFWSSAHERSPPPSQWFTTYWWRHHLIEEQDVVGKTLATYVYGDSSHGLIQMRRGTSDFFYHSDDLGNVLALTDSNGRVVERYEYDDFGAPEFFDAGGSRISSSRVGNPFLFHGLQFDSETGYFYGGTSSVPYDNKPVARYYLENAWPMKCYFDPAAGRYLSRIQPDETGNAFTFSANNPATPIKYTLFLANGTPTWSGGSDPDRGYRVKVKYPWLPALPPHGHLDYLKQVGDPETAGPIGHWPTVSGLSAEHEVSEYGYEHGMFFGVGSYHRSAGSTRSFIQPKGFQIISAGRDSLPVQTGNWIRDVTCQVEPVSAYFNPKELTFGKSVPWGQAGARSRGSLLPPRLGWEVTVGNSRSVGSRTILRRLSDPHPSRSGWTGWSSFYRSF